MADLTFNGDRKDFRVVGKPNLPGKLSKAVATGLAKFGIDYVIPNMVEAVFMRSPHAHARVKSYNKEKAMAVPGVVDIVTWEDEDMKKLTRGGGMGGPPAPFLSNVAEEENVEVGFIAIAETVDICEEALRQLDVEWEVLPHIVDIRKGREPGAPVIRPEDRGGVANPFGGRGGSKNPPKKGNVSYSNQEQGDMEKGFREADHIIEYDLNMPTYASASPNPHSSVAWWFDDPYLGEDNLHIEGAVWHASGGKNAIAQMYGLTPEKDRTGGSLPGWQVLRLDDPQITADHPVPFKKGGKARTLCQYAQGHIRFHGPAAIYPHEGGLQKRRHDYRFRRLLDSRRRHHGQFVFRNHRRPGVQSIHRNQMYEYTSENGCCGQ